MGPSMAEWREKGYVPDSDEEDDSQEPSGKEPQFRIAEAIQNIAPEATFESHGTGDRTSGGLDEAEEIENEKVFSGSDSAGVTDAIEEINVDRQAQNHQEGRVEEQSQVIPAANEYVEDGNQALGAAWDLSRASSPLSEAPSSPPDFPTFLNLHAEPHVGSPLGDDRRSSALPDLDVIDEPASIRQQTEHGETFHAGRTFRHRNAIQLHPYVIEKEKFNQTWRARGLKPVHILQEEAAKAQAQQDESQNFEISDDANSPASSPPLRSTASRVSPSLQPGAVFGADDDDLPDVHALLEANLPNFASVGHKRRKMGPKFRKPPRLPPRIEDTLPVTLTSRLPDNETSIFDAPPSPPLSGSQTSSASVLFTEPLFRIPPGVKNPSLPTPVTSSEPRKRQSRRTVINADSDELSSASERTDHVSDEADASSADEEEESHQLHRVQRRIKGVLPASWLKLDLKTHAKQPQQERRYPTSALIDQDKNQKGVARPVDRYSSRRSSRSASPREVLVLSDDDDTVSSLDSKIMSHIALADPSPFDTIQSQSIDFRGEAMEDNSVDTLLPPAKWLRPNAPRPRKRQTRIADFGIREKPTSTKAIATSPAPGSPQIYRDRSMPKIKRKPKFRPPNLSILDATERQNDPEHSHPAFVKVARRTARLRHDRGRHSPSRKSIKLATRNDTDDVSNTVQAWRDGSIAQCLIESPQTRRKPLYPRSVNDAPRSNHSRPTKTRKQTKLLASMSSSSRHPGKTKRFQSALDGLVSRRPPQEIDGSHLKSPLAQVLHHHKGERQKGQLYSSLKTSAERRPALLESSQTKQDDLHPQNALYRSLLNSDRSAHDYESRRPVLDRFLRDEDPLAVVQRVQTPKTLLPDSNIPKSRQSRAIRARKRKPRRFDIESLELYERTSPTVDNDSIDHNSARSIQPITQINRLRGLGPFGTRYTATFDVKSLPAGSSFPTDTFVGSGNFAKSLALQDNCNLDRSRGFYSFTCNNRHLRWGVWNEKLSSEMGEVFQRIEQGVQSVTRQDFEIDAPTGEEALNLQTAAISYLSSHVSFSDAVDRIGLLQRCKGLLNAFWNACSSAAIIPLRERANKNTIPEHFETQIAMLGLVFTNQLRQISNHNVVPLQMKHEIIAVVDTSANQLCSLIGPRLNEFEDYLAKSRRALENGPPPKIDRLIIEAFVIANHVTRRADTRELYALELMRGSLACISTENNIDVRLSERAWQKLFALLPFLEVDEQGALDVGQRFRNPRGDWTLVKRLINPVLEIYLSDPRGQGPGFNAYCRSLFSRCLHLINGWGWYHCETIIGTIFDFFAKNGLAHLRNEQSHGSPPFLEDLSKNPPLDARPEDLCFHLLLKIIGSGIKHMRTFSNPKRVRDLVWRLMPNHGRSHPKEQAVRQEDLDALRNHHDLLCTLYWASPPGFRPSLNGIRTLVDLERSHREACHINIRAWFNLVKFQLSIDEPAEDLEPFAQWHSDLLQQMLRQHRLARTEAEDQVSAAQSVNGLSVSLERLELTIARNQRQVEAVLDDALVCLELAIGAAKTQEAATVLLCRTLTGAFSLYDGSKALTSGVVIKALNVLLAYTKKRTTKKQQSLPHCENDDSQDYGDWSAFHDDEALEAEPVAQISSPLPQIMGPLRSLVSDCFGADTTPPENLLTKVLDTWAGVICVLVEDGVKTWEDYLGQFGTDTWYTLRDTDQTRKYAAYFFSSLIETNMQIFRDNRTYIMKYWLGSLVERESLLKFQHNFTSSLLNLTSNDPLLENLPFWRSNSAAQFSITALEFSDRRLSLISSILSNMRLSLGVASFDSDSIAAQLKQDYKDLLKHLMTTMKQNYLELGQGSHIRGAYVDFVHCVVEFLQEHTSFIYPVDRFFTDSAAFPLPNSDPNYVVGKLKNYGKRMSDPKMQKELVVFLQSVSERAVADDQQEHFVQQLHTAMSKSFKESASESTLCKFMVNAIVSAYMQTAFDCPVGWVFVMPYLEALERVFRRIHLDLNGCDKGSLDSCMSILTGYLDCARTAMHSLTNEINCFGSASVMKTLAGCYRVIVALLPTLDYMLRVGPHKAQGLALEVVAFFKSFSEYTHAIIAPLTSITAPMVDELSSIDHSLKDPQYDAMHRFALRELQSMLMKNWLRVGDDYFVSRGSSRQQVSVDIGSFEEERDGLRLALHEFGECLSGLSGLGGWEEWREITKRGQNGFDFDDLCS